MATLNIKRIKGDPNNVRTKVSVAGIADLAKSIKANGLLQPIIIRPDGNGYLVIAGHRRLAAIGELVAAKEHDGELTLDRDVILRAEDLSAAEITVQQLVENLQREDIDVLDEAMGFMRLLEFDMSQAEIARMVGRSRGHVTKRLALVTLPDEAKKKLTKGEIRIEHALALASLDAEDQAAYVEEGRWDEYTIQRMIRGQKGKAVATKLTTELLNLGLKVEDFKGQPSEWPADEGYRWETIEVVWAEDFTGSVPEGALMGVVSPNGEQASVRFYGQVEIDTRKANAEDKRVEKEKAQRKAERVENSAKLNFLANALTKVKAKDAEDMALSMVLDRVGFSNAKDICVLLDLDVPTKAEMTYDGKTREVKQYYPLILSLIKEARTDGDIGFIRRVVMATASTFGYTEDLLERLGYSPEEAA